MDVRYALLACLGLAGCAPADPGPTVSDASMPGVTRADGRRYAIPFAVTANTRSHVNSWFSLNADCSLNQYVGVQLLAPPQHGSFTITRGEYYPTYPTRNQRSACNLHPQEGVAAFYDPAPGYVGPDLATILVIEPDGQSWTTDFHLSVK